MSYTSNDVERTKESYQEWARTRDREQFLEYVAWLRANSEYLKRSRQHELSSRS